MNRRQLLQLGGAVALAPFSSLRGAEESTDRFWFAVIADSHVIDDLYKDGTDESILNSRQRLTAARDHLNSLRPRMDLTFLVGDYFHDYPSPDVDFYFQNTTRIDNAKAITDGFAMPVHVGFGNHDYDVPRMSREASHELFRRKLGLKPYYSVDHKGWKFVHLNNFLGNTWSSDPATFKKGTGSLGEEQLNWFEAELKQQKPTFVFVHYPLPSILRAEIADYGLHSLLRRHRDTVQRVISGHRHQWIDLGSTFGPPHLVIAATRFDPDAYLIVEVDRNKATHRLLNIDRVQWNTHFSDPFSF
jgi:hypothetical protein